MNVAITNGATIPVLTLVSMFRRLWLGPGYRTLVLQDQRQRIGVVLSRIAGDGDSVSIADRRAAIVAVTVIVLVLAAAQEKVKALTRLLV